MNRRTKYPPELRERAIRMVYEQREHHESQWAAIESVAQKIGCTAQTLRNWITRAKGKAGVDDAASARFVTLTFRNASSFGMIVVSRIY